MEDVPPSYESAIDREAWNVIAPWISSGDLCSACLVSRKWHNIFISFLWGDPASHFGTENDAVYVALTRFKRTLKRARASVRQLTHTLHLPPALSEIYGGPNPTWLRDVLEYLPNLQSLAVSKLPFFDHLSLLALRHASTSKRGSIDDTDDDGPTYGLKLLLAVSEPNTTSVGLATGLRHFPHLVYLDLSHTLPARDASVLSALSGLYDLQVLKLRGTGMRDGEAEVLANAIGIRVRVLDLRENNLTDMAVRSLMQACFMPADRLRNGNSNSRRVEDWPVGIAPGPDFLSLDSLRSEDLDQELLRQLTNPLTGRLAFEDIPHKGLTHLYIADNHLSVEGLSSLLKSSRLHVLDGGSATNVKEIARTISLSSPTGYTDEVTFPGAEKLIPVLGTYASKALTYARLDHAIVTKQLQPRDVPSPSSSVAELPTPITSAAELPPEERAVFEAPAPAHMPVEMPTEGEPIFELSGESAAPKYELVGDCIQFALSPPVGDAPVSSPSESQAAAQPIRGDGAFAPEVVTNGHDQEDDESSDEEIVLNASGTGMTAKKSKAQKVNAGTILTPSTATPPTPMTALPPPNGHVNFNTAAEHRQSVSHSVRIHRIDTILHKRPRAVASMTSTGNGLGNGLINPKSTAITELHPCMLPHLRTLVLTEVPSTVPQSSPIIPALRNFLSACADEAQLALLRAQTNYSLPPGRSRQAAELQHARSLFALRQIVLEIAPPKPKGQDRRDTKGWHHLRQRESMSKSSTGDHDSENLWSAAENDFSFFGEEGEEQDECGIYQHDPDKYFPTAHSDEKILLSPDEMRHASTYMSGSPHGSLISIDTPSTLLRSPTVLQSPRNLPLGRNRRSSSAANSAHSGETFRSELAGTIPTSNPVPKTSVPPTEMEPMLDVVAELAKFRREKKAEYEGALLRWRIANNPQNGAVVDERDMPFIEGHWKGDIKVVRNAAPKGRTGIVDMYGNYFEKGYLYP